MPFLRDGAWWVYLVPCPFQGVDMSKSGYVQGLGMSRRRWVLSPVGVVMSRRWWVCVGGYDWGVSTHPSQILGYYGIR